MEIDRRKAIGVALGGVVMGGAAMALPISVLKAQTHGTFSGPAQIETAGSGRMRLTSPFWYHDPRNVRWTVPTGYVSDGASIPRFLWALVGSPWTGNYGDAAILHDFYCDEMSRSWEDTHRLFYDAMIARGVDRKEAGKKYWAVLNFGPRWNAFQRWTSFLGLDKKPRWRIEVRGIMLPEGAPPAATAMDIEEREDAEETLIAYQEGEFARVSALIDAGDYSAAQIRDLKPQAPGIEVVEAAAIAGEDLTGLAVSADDTED